MLNSETFDQELNYIEDTKLRNFVSNVLNQLPDYFRHIGASTSGKYHPAYTLGEGGLVRHTKAAVGIAKELIRAELPFAEIEDSIDSDVVYSALILHDGLKCGMWEDHTAFDHPMLMAHFIKDMADKLNYEDSVYVRRICKCIESHMGKWNTNKDYGYSLPTPKTGLQQLVHLCDVDGSVD
jgi:23S rRNA maturation-related 3'-5' exoribonuclease YhaM